MGLILDSKAQGTIEYLVTIAVIIVISLLVVAVVSNNFDSFTGISSTSSKISSSSGLISISEAVLDNSGDGLISLGNISGGLLTITGINVSGKDMNYDNVNISQGEEKYFSLSDAGSGCSCVGLEGKTKTCEVIIYAESEYGLEKQFSATVSVDCVSDASQVTLSSGTQLVLNSNEIITGFSFSGLDSGGTTTINLSTHMIDITVPFNADVNNLNPIISTIPGVTIDPLGSQNFSNPIVYTITMPSGSTQTYTVSVSVLPSTSTQLITDFNFGSFGSSIINQKNHTIVVTVPYGTDISNLDPSIGLVSGVTIEPTGPQNFSSPVDYNITANDGLSQIYTITVIVSLNTAKAITAFDFSSPPVVGDVNESTHTVILSVPNGTDVTALVPTITITGISINPASGIAQNFTNQVTYTVTAADDSTQDYNVIVNTLPTSSYNITLNVKDSSTNEDLTGFSMDCNVNDYDFIEQDSPKIINFNAGSYSCVFSKTGYDSNTVTIIADNNKSMTIFLPFQINLSNCATLSTNGGYYNLTNNIGSGGTCLTIAADNITIKGNEYTITGNIDATNLTGPAWTNLSIKDVTINGNVFSNGKNNSSGVGFHGGDVTVNNSDITNIYAYGGDTTCTYLGCNGGFGGNVTLIDSNVTIIDSNGGQTPQYQTCGDGGSITLTNSNATTVNSNTGITCTFYASSGGNFLATNSEISYVNMIGGGGAVTLSDSNIITINAHGRNDKWGNGSSMNITNSSVNAIYSYGARTMDCYQCGGGNGGDLNISNSEISIIEAYGGEGIGQDAKGGDGGTIIFNPCPTPKPSVIITGGIGTPNGADGTITPSDCHNP
ncbi:MAG: hypothetical protein WC462_02295 [archaeon]